LGKGWAILIAGLIVFYSVVLIFAYTPRMNIPSADTVSPDTAKLLVQANQDFLIFNGTIFVACVVGLITLLPEIRTIFEKGGKLSRITLSIIYYLLVGGTIVSVSDGYTNLRENFSLFFSQNFGSDLKSYLNTTTFSGFYNFIQDWKGMVVGLTTVIFLVVIFNLLFYSYAKKGN